MILQGNFAVEMNSNWKALPIPSAKTRCSVVVLLVVSIVHPSVVVWVQVIGKDV